MALQFIFGGSGSGKTHYIQKKIVGEADQFPHKNFFYIVPEQFTMESQRELVVMQQANCVMNIDIVSFARLAYRIFDELGNFHYQVLEETGKNLILRRVAQANQEKLSVLQKNITKMGYISEMKSLISELAQYNVTPEDLEKVCEEISEGSFSMKLKDVLVMYQGFLDFLRDKFVTQEEILELLIDAADSSKLLRDSILVFDGFTGFTPIQKKLFRKLLVLADEIYVTVTIDERESFYRCTGNHELFAMSKKMISSLTKMAGDCHVEILKPVVIPAGKNSRFKQGSALFFLQQNLFRGGLERFCQKEEEIKITSCKNPREELKYIAGEIRRLISQGQYRYNEIAIVCGDLPAYGSYAREIFGDYDIPLFLDQKTRIVFHPFIEFFQSLLEAVRMDFSCDSIFRYLRSGLSRIPREEVDVLENYVLAAGIRGFKKWQEIFSYVPGGFTGEDVVEINQIREKVAGQFQKIYPALRRRDATVKEFCQEVYLFITEREIQKQLKKKEEAYERAGDLKNAKEYAQIYRIVMDLLDKMVELLGDEIISLEEYGKIMDAGFEAAKVGIIPPGYDRVVFGDIERTRLDNIKVLFFAGVNDGVIPKSQGADGILSQWERELLQEHDMELAPTAREQTFIQKFYLYLNLTKPSKRLFISYARVDGEGKAMRSSYLVHTILNMFENLSVKEVENPPLEERIVTEKNSFFLVAEGLFLGGDWAREKKEREQVLWGALCRYFDRDEGLKKEIEKLFAAAAFKQGDSKIAAAVTRALYGSTLENSVTRLEKFASCAFAHFLSYGLNLKERELSGFAAVDMGNIFHQVLELYAKRMEREGFSWFEISKEDSENLLGLAMEEALSRNSNLALYDNARNAYGKQRMYRILKRTVWALTKQIRRGSFVPESFEVSFDFPEHIEAVHFLLNDQETMHLKGRIDRIDTLHQEDKLYVKVIDYKSGNTTFQFLNVYHGLQLQLVVYMNAALEMMERRHPGKEIVPAGVFYYHVKDPVVEAEGELSEEELKQKIFGELKLNGVLSDDRMVVEEMDRELLEGGSGNSDVIPVGINKDGSLKKTSKTISREDFFALSSYVNETILHLGNRMMQGSISANPYSLGDKKGCDYCEFKNICHFDAKIPGYSYRQLEELSKEEILEKMRERRWASEVDG
ncbi:MAG: helicase-exonuclease AddAB subunit AddB [Lachnospiraceae bacterium]|nr:helicase-exonuclease AddAB subunit AddB [Lachnospiraceae bacterium]